MGRSIDRRKGKSKEQVSMGARKRERDKPGVSGVQQEARCACARGCVAAPRVAWSWTRVVRALVRLDSRVGAVVTRRAPLSLFPSLFLSLYLSLSSFLVHTLRASRELFFLPLSPSLSFARIFSRAFSSFERRFLADNMCILGGGTWFVYDKYM